MYCDCQHGTDREPAILFCFGESIRRIVRHRMHDHYTGHLAEDSILPNPVSRRGQCGAVLRSADCRCGSMSAGVAQLVERLICNQRVGGSNPSASSIVNGRRNMIDPNFLEWYKELDYELFKREVESREEALSRVDPESRFGFTMDDAAYLGALDRAFRDYSAIDPYITLWWIAVKDDVVLRGV